jgi:hypothetical protein
LQSEIHKLKVEREKLLAAAQERAQMAENIKRLHAEIASHTQSKVKLQVR